MSSSRPSSDDRRRERVEQALGDVRAASSAGDVLEQDRELVAAEPRERCPRRAARLGRRSRDRAQQLVAGRVAEAVVDRLEVVEVDEQHRELVARGAAVARERLLEAVLEQRPVGEPGQRVVERLVLQLWRTFRPSAKRPGDPVGDGLEGGSGPGCPVALVRLDVDDPEELAGLRERHRISLFT